MNAVDELQKALNLIQANDDESGNSEDIDAAAECVSKVLQELRAVSCMHVGDYFEEKFGQGAVKRYSGDCQRQDFEDYTLDTHCGVTCYAIINEAVKLLSMCDTHPHVVDNIRKGVIAACEVICFG